MTDQQADLREHESPEALAADAAEQLLVTLRDVQSRGSVAHIGLTGGTIAETLHEVLGSVGPDSGVDWTKVAFWWGDERFVAGDSPDRNCGQARAAFLDRVGVDPARVHEVPSSDDVASVADAADAYARTLRSAGATEFDVLMLGMGPDGHVASLFPGFAQLDVADAPTVPVTGSPKPPPERVSLTFPALNRAREVWFLVSGSGKADAVAAALAPEGDVHTTPARGVTGRRRTVWFLDADAASKLA